MKSFFLIFLLISAFLVSCSDDKSKNKGGNSESDVDLISGDNNQFDDGANLSDSDLISDFDELNDSSADNDFNDGNSDEINDSSDDEFSDKDSLVDDDSDNSADEDDADPVEEVECDDEPAIFVTTTAESGEGSLKEAILQAESGNSPKLIKFKIPESDENYDEKSDSWIIPITTSLPNLSSGNIVIDGDSQKCFIGNIQEMRPVIELKASIKIPYPILIMSENNTISGITSGGFSSGIILYGENASGNIIKNSYFGVASDGITAINNDNGIIITEGAHENTISKTLLSGNGTAGLYIGGKTTVKNILQNSIVGADITGSERIENGVGVLVTKSAENRIENNIISGNLDSGIAVSGKFAEKNVITGNLIGVDKTGTKLLWNDKGVVFKSLANNNIIGGLTEKERNIITGNIEIGIYIEAADGNKILGNYIGTDITGTKIVEKDGLMQGNGVEFNTVAKNNLLGGTEKGAMNIVSGNKVYGVVYYGHCEQNDTIGNMIGADVTGTKSIPNATGICFDCASHHNDVAFNVISGNMSYGMFFVTRGTEFNTLRGNMIGVDVTGTKALPNDIGMVVSTGAANNIVGGENVSDRNIISGNTQSGIMVTNHLTENNVITNNYIGLSSDGKTYIPNRHGILFSTYPARNEVSGNDIKGNTDAGVILYEYSEFNTIKGNRISGSNAGIVVDQRSHHNTIGSVAEPNTISYNKNIGIVMLEYAGNNNTISGNRIIENNGAAIDIFPFGINQNDAGDIDSGVNMGMNLPVIESVSCVAGNCEVTGFIDTINPASVVIEVFEGYCIGNMPQTEKFLKSFNSASDGAFKITLPEPSDGVVFTFTATDADGNTSELSAKCGG